MGLDSGSERPKQIQVRFPISVGDFAEAAGLDPLSVKDDLRRMRINPRLDALVPGDVLQKIGKAHGIDVQVLPPLKYPPRPV